MAAALLMPACAPAQPPATIRAARTPRRRAPTVRDLARKIRAVERKIDRLSEADFDRLCCGGPLDVEASGLREQLAVAPARSLGDLGEKVALLRELLEEASSDPRRDAGRGDGGRPRADAWARRERLGRV